MSPKTAATGSALHPLLAERWSPRGFDRTAQLTAAQTTALLEAARWSPSASNSQPWRFLVAHRGTPEFARVFATLAPGNQAWAGAAAALVVAAATTADADGSPLPWALYDTGQAIAHLSTQAAHEGLAVHQMGGFDRTALAGALGLAEPLVPVVVVAVGRRTDEHDLPQPFAEREAAPRTRLPLPDLLLDTPAAERTAA